MSQPDNRKRWVLMGVLIAMSSGINGVCMHFEMGWQGATFATLVPLATAQNHGWGSPDGT